jgi:methyl-accepting chemotaxis protein
VAAVKSQVMAQTVVTRSLSSSRIAGYGLVKDLNGQPRFVARIEGPRPIQIQGQAALRYYLLALAVAIAIACLLTLLVLDRLLVRRITGLSGQLGRITDMAGTLGQVKMAGRDEIGHLASSINAMLRRIYESRGLEQRNTALEEQVAVRTAELNEQLNETRRINQLMVDRELKMVELKEQLAQYEGKPRPKGSKNSAAAESE